MRKFWGFYQNEEYSIGCNGGTVYVYGRDGKELAKFKDFPYAYQAAFMPDRNIIAVKSTEGYLGFYDLETLSLIKKITVTRIGAQDDGFIFSPDGRCFYNIESPVVSTRTQLGVYETATFSKVNTLFADNEKMVLQQLEFDAKTDTCYVAGFMRNEEGVFDYGFAAVLDEKGQTINDVLKISREKYKYLIAYKHWEMMGFTDKALEWNYTLKELDTIDKISIKEVYDEVEKDQL